MKSHMIYSFFYHGFLVICVLSKENGREVHLMSYLFLFFVIAGFLARLLDYCVLYGCSHRVHTEWQWQLSGIHYVKSAQSGKDGGAC
jgi:hypothetical protein